MEILIGLFWLGLIITAGMFVFSIAIGLFGMVLGLVISALSWVWSKIKGE